MHVWDIRDGLTKFLLKKVVDNGSGQLFPMYDEGLNTLFIAGKGDTTLRGYEIVHLLHDVDANAETVETATNLEEASSSSVQKSCTMEFEKSLDFQTTPSEPFAGICLLPKRLCDFRNIEVARFLKLSTDAVIPMTFTVPRADHLKKYFHDDIFPPVRSKQSELTVDDWTSPDTPAMLFQPITESLSTGFNDDGSEIVNISDKPPDVVAPSEAKSKISYFNEKIIREEEEAKVRADNLTRFRQMAQQNAEFHVNLSGGVKKIGGVIITDNTNADDDSDAGWSDED